jgi:uncharacterized short protein YbdD (DUF466 family)
MLSLDDALKYVNLKTSSAKKYREYAVSDFSNYIEQLKKHVPDASQRTIGCWRLALHGKSASAHTRLSWKRGAISSISRSL